MCYGRINNIQTREKLIHRLFLQKKDITYYNMHICVEILNIINKKRDFLSLIFFKA